MQFRKPVFVSKLSVFKPLTYGNPAVVSKRSHAQCQLFVVGNDHSTFARRDLLIGIKAKHARSSERSYSLAAPFGSQRLARVFNQDQLVALRNRQKFFDVRRNAER